MDSEKLNEQWRAISAQVSSYADMDASQVSAFFSRLEPQAMSDSFLMLTADNDFIKSWVEQHYVEPIQRALRDLTGVQFVVAVAVDPRSPKSRIGNRNRACCRQRGYGTGSRCGYDTGSAPRPARNGHARNTGSAPRAGAGPGRGAWTGNTPPNLFPYGHRSAVDSPPTLYAPL